VVDKTALGNKILELETTPRGTYTQASWSAFQAALNAARAMMINGEATQGEVNAALNNLNAAFSPGLVAQALPTVNSIQRTNEIFWRRFLNVITFSLAYRDYQRVTIASGATVVKTEYYVGPRGLTDAQVKALPASSWTLYNGPFYIHPGYFIRLISPKTVYVRVTDDLGQVAYRAA